MTLSSYSFSSTVKEAIVSAADETSIAYYIMSKVAYLESNHNPNAVNGNTRSSAKGLFQITKFISDHYKKTINREYDIFDPYYNSLIASKLMKDNVNYIYRKYKVCFNLKLEEYYLLHFLGASKTYKFMQAEPSDIGKEMFPQAYEWNKSIFTRKDGTFRTIFEIRAYLRNRMNKAKVL